MWTVKSHHECSRALHGHGDMDGRGGMGRGRAFQLGIQVIEIFQAIQAIKVADSQIVTGDSGSAAVCRSGGIRKSGGCRASGFCLSVSNGRRRSAVTRVRFSR